MSAEDTEEKPFCVDRAKQGRATCKKCKQKCTVGELRMAKIAPSPFGTGNMKTWYHVECMFEQLLSQRVTTKRIESTDDIDGWDNLTSEDQDQLLKKIEESENDFAKKHGQKYSPKKITAKPSVPHSNKNGLQKTGGENSVKPSKDGSFRAFRQLVTDITNVDGYNEKTNIVKNFFTRGTDGQSFKGNVTQWCRLLLPGVVKRIYNLQNKQLLKLFSRLFNVDQQLMTDCLNQGDIGETIQEFFENSTASKPCKSSILSIQEVDDFLEQLSQMSKEEDQLNHLQGVVCRCTSNDLKFIVRLIKHDLRMNAGAKHILQGVHSDAYEAYQKSRDLNAVIKRFMSDSSQETTETTGVRLLTPIQPMLAEACKSVEQAMKKCPNGMYSEIKYDGERVQVHKHGTEFKYFSRSLKPVLHHKVAHLEQYIVKAFPEGSNLILDSEILMIDHDTGQPLPFGTLGVHKKSEFKNANVCLFVFDCIYYNGESLIEKPLHYRKKVLQENMTEIPNRIMFSKMESIRTPKVLAAMIAEVLGLGLEGLVLKDIESVYAPGKRHWLKVKKDYLLDGAMADSADLIVLGAWYGTGRKAGMKSVFLMGCYDNITARFCTVTKVHTGHDDKTLEQIQKELEMYEIGCNYDKVPRWLSCSKSMTPDFVAKDPKKQPVWEITGAEFTKHDVHTANGISIRFPRVTRIRLDKTWETSTTLQELQNLYTTSKESTDYAALMNVDAADVASTSAGSNGTSKKRKLVNSPSTSSSSKVQKTLTGSKKISNSTEKQSINIKDPLITIFKDVQLLLEDGAKELFKRWLRYFVAYGGTILDSKNWSKATHVLHLEHTATTQSIRCPKNSRHIIIEWIKDSVSTRKLEDCVPYTVRWEPELSS